MDGNDREERGIKMHTNTIIKTVFGAVATGFTTLFGGWDIALQILLIFIATDYLTGVMRAILEKSLSSEQGWKGLMKKASIFIVLLVAVSIDRLTGNDVWMFRTIVSYFFIANEGISILENVASLGIPIPQKLLDILKQLKDDGKKAINK